MAGTSKRSGTSVNVNVRCGGKETTALESAAGGAHGAA